MKTTKILHLALMAALAFPLGANAALIIDNGDAVAGGGSGTSDLDAISTGGIYQEIADDFTLSAALSLTDISWSGAYTPSNQANAVPDDFTIRVLDNAFGLDIYRYSTSLAPLHLAAGSYWLSIVNNTPGDAEGQRWSWSVTGGVNGSAGVFRQSVGTPLTGSDPWNATASDFSFKIVAVPEPGTLGLLGLGLFGMVAARRRKTR